MKKDIQKYSDLELFEALSSSKEEAELAFTQIYSKYSLKVYHYCLTLVDSKEDANDIYQETFFKIFQAAQKKPDIKNLKQYLFITARNLAYNQKRIAKRYVSLENYQIPDNNNDIENKELSDYINYAISLLKPNIREVFVLRYYHNLNYEEIEAITGDDNKSLRAAFWRAKQKLKSILEPYLNEEINNK